MSGHRFRYAQPEQAAQACARHIRARLEEALAGAPAASLAVSGGSSPKLMFAHLTDEPFPWDRVLLFWADERCVPPGDPHSNFTMAEAHLIRPAGIPQRNVHRIRGEIRPGDASERYAAEIRDALGTPPRFDVIHLGMGPDGHTASLFPGEAMIEDSDGVAAAVYVEKFSQWRVTLLPAVLLGARHTVFFATGADKAVMLRKVLDDRYEPIKYPAQLIAHHGRGVAWFLDDAAAALLE
ncbi:MAG: 6-phosphogluconolactonase [Bryobacteraceae bacterium]